MLQKNGVSAAGWCRRTLFGMDDDLDESGSHPSSVKMSRNVVCITFETSASAHALSELFLLRETLSAAVTSGKRARVIESSCGASFAFVREETSQLASVGVCDSTLPDLRLVSSDDVKKSEVQNLDEANQPHTVCCRFHNPRVIDPCRPSAPPKVTLLAR